MEKNNVKLEWEGEKIKQSMKVEPIKFGPKELIDAIDHATGEIEKLIEQRDKIKTNIVNIEKDISNAKVFRVDRQKFEDKCIEILTEKLHKYFEAGKEEWIAESIIETEAIYAKDPNAYTDQQVNNQKYVLLQRKFATSKKVAENIPARLIRELIFDTPFYENPFN